MGAQLATFVAALEREENSFSYMYRYFSKLLLQSSRGSE